MSATESFSPSALFEVYKKTLKITVLDTDTLVTSVNNTGRALIAHEAVRSVGAEVAERLHEHCSPNLKAPTRRVASKDVAVPFACILEQEFLYKASDIAAAIRQTVEGK